MMYRRWGSILAVFVSAVVLFVASGCVDCDGIRQDARALRADYARCSSGDTCQIVNLYDLAGSHNCLSVFQCSSAMRANANLDEFRARARDLVKEFSRCGECAMADCAAVEDEEAYCNSDSGQCELRRAQP